MLVRKEFQVLNETILDYNTDYVCVIIFRLEKMIYFWSTCELLSIYSEMICFWFTSDVLLIYCPKLSKIAGKMLPDFSGKLIYFWSIPLVQSDFTIILIYFWSVCR